MKMAYSLFTQSGGLIKVKALASARSATLAVRRTLTRVNHRGRVGLGSGEAVKSGPCIDEIGR